MEIVGSFTEADEANWKTQSVGDSEHHASLRRTVELGEHDASEWEVFLKLFCLSESVLPVRRVNDQQYFVRRTRQSALPAVVEPRRLRPEPSRVGCSCFTRSRRTQPTSE